MREHPRIFSAAHHRHDDDVGMHQHPQHEVILVRQGDLRTAILGADHALSAGAMLVVPAHVAHDQRTRGAWWTTCLLFEGWVQPADAAVVLTAGPPDALRWSAEAVAAFDAGRGEVADGLLLAVLASVAAAQRDAAEAEEHAHPALRRILDALAADPRLEPDAALLARLAGISPSRLRTLFHGRYGCGPVQYIHRHRMTRAARLLTDPYRSVHDVATACGYGDANYFARRFRQEFGLSPRGFRAEATRLGSGRGRSRHVASTSRLPDGRGPRRPSAQK